MKKLFALIPIIIILITFLAPAATVNAASTPQPIAPVVTTKPDDTGWEGFTTRPALKFYVDETAANNTGNIFDPVDGSRIFRNYTNAVNYRTANYPGEPVEINLRSDITTVPNFGVTLVDILIEGNGHSFKRVSGSVTRAFETSRQISNAEFRNVNFDGGNFVYTYGFIIEGIVQHRNLKFTNVNINITVDASAQSNGALVPTRVFSIFDASDVTFENVSFAGSVLLNSTGYQWPIHIYSNCHNMDLSGITAMPVNDSGDPVAIGLWNNFNGPETEPYNIYAPDFPYLLTYRYSNVHRTLAFSNLDDAKAFANENASLSPKYIYADGTELESVIDLTASIFFISNAEIFENTVNFLNCSEHAPDHSAAITDPSNLTMTIGEQGSRVFKITDSANSSYVLDFSGATKDIDYILESSDDNVISSVGLSVGNSDNKISFTAIGVGKTTISLKTMSGTIVCSFEVTVNAADLAITEPESPDSSVEPEIPNSSVEPETPNSSTVPQTGDTGINPALTLLVFPAVILTAFYVAEKSKSKQ